MRSYVKTKQTKQPQGRWSQLPLTLLTGKECGADHLHGYGHLGSDSAPHPLSSSVKEGHLGNPLDFVGVRDTGTALFVPLETNVAEV